MKDKIQSKLADLLGKSFAPSKKAVAEKLVRNGELQRLRQGRIASGEVVPWSILRYQRVIAAKDYPLPILPFSHVTPETFESHLRYIKLSCNPMPLGELVERIYFGKEIPERAVALTFDYGHSDFFLNAFPLLLQYEIPATVCLASGYTNTETFLPVDKITFGLEALRHFKQGIPPFPCFSESFHETLKDSYEDGEISPQSILLFVDAFNALQEIEKMNLVAQFAAALQDEVDLPVYEDFLRWEDISRLVEHGVTFAMMGHGALDSSKCQLDEFKTDILHCLDRMAHYKVPREKYFCLPHGAFTEQSLELLNELKLRIALSIGDFPHPEKQELPVQVLGRTMIAEENSNTEELFACRMARCVYENIEF